MIPWLIADLIDRVVSPFGFDVYVVGTFGRRGLDRISILRRPAGTPRPKRLRPVA